MHEPYILYAVAFVLVFTMVRVLHVGVDGLFRSRLRTTERFGALDRPQRPMQGVEVLRKRASLFRNSPVIARLHLLILQSGTRLTASALATICCSASVVLFFILPATTAVILRMIAAGLGATCLVGGYLRVKRARRVARFGDQLPDVIEVIVRSLRAGHPLPVSLSLVAREMPEPAGAEFAIVVDEVSYGRDIGGALEALHRRVGYPDLKFLVASIAIAHQTGGNLGDILSRLSRMLRDRFRLRRKVRAVSAEGRFSGYALSSLPIILFGLINLVSPSFYSEFWASSASSTILVVSSALLLVGNIIIYKMVNFKV